MELDKYSKYFTENRFFRMLKKLTREGSGKFVEETCALYLLMKSSDTPKWVKGMLIGTLGYVVLPTDLIPDFLPVMGLTDDAALVASVYGKVQNYISEEQREKAKQFADNFVPPVKTEG